jgi:hypothetical protein
MGTRICFGLLCLLRAGLASLTKQCESGSDLLCIGSRTARPSSFQLHRVLFASSQFRVLPEIALAADSQARVPGAHRRYFAFRIAGRPRARCADRGSGTTSHVCLGQRDGGDQFTAGPRYVHASPMVRSVPPSLVGSGRSSFGIGTQEATTWCIEKGISSPRHDPLRRGGQGMCRVLVAIDGKPRRLLFQLFEIDDRRIILVTIVSIKPHSDGK